MTNAAAARRGRPPGNSSGRPERYEVARLTTDAELSSLRDEWDELVARCSSATPFQTFEWQWSWWKSFGQDRKLLVVTVRTAGENGRGTLVAIAPFTISFRQGLRIVELLGTGLSDYLDVIVTGSEHDVVGLILDELLETPRWDVTLFQTPESAVANPAALRRVAVERSLLVVDRPYEIAPFLAVAGRWDDFVKGKSKKFRYSLRERLARFNDTEGASFRRLEGTAVDGELAAPMWQVEQQSWKSHAGTAMMHSAEVREFYRSILTAFGKKGWANVWLAYIGDRPVAYVLTFIFAGRTYLYTLSFDSAFNRLAPGMLLLQESIRTAFDEGSTEYDFLCGDEPYKDRWTESRRRVAQTVLMRRTPRGWVGGLVAFRLRWALARSDRLRATRLRLIGLWSRFTNRGGERSTADAVVSKDDGTP